MSTIEAITERASRLAAGEPIVVTTEEYYVMRAAAIEQARYAAAGDELTFMGHPVRVETERDRLRAEIAELKSTDHYQRSLDEMHLRYNVEAERDRYKRNLGAVMALIKPTDTCECLDVWCTCCECGKFDAAYPHSDGYLAFNEMRDKKWIYDQIVSMGLDQ